jgi:hypothetical protein
VQKRFGRCAPVAVQEDLAGRIEDTEVHGACVQVDARSSIGVAACRIS